MNSPVKSRNLEPPTLEDVIATRKRVGDSMERAGRRVYVLQETWWRWETGKREMPGAARELYIIKAKRLERKRAKRKELARTNRAATN